MSTLWSEYTFARQRETLCVLRKNLYTIMLMWKHYYKDIPNNICSWHQVFNLGSRARGHDYLSIQRFSFPFPIKLSWASHPFLYLRPLSLALLCFFSLHSFYQHPLFLLRLALLPCSVSLPIFPSFCCLLLHFLLISSPALTVCSHVFHLWLCVYSTQSLSTQTVSASMTPVTPSLQISACISSSISKSNSLCISLSRLTYIN